MRTHIIQTNFTSGEITPKLAGRVDIARYSNAAKTAENVTVVMQGGLRRRDGLRFVYEAKKPNSPIKLIPWVFNREQSYVLEVGDRYIRLFQAGKIVMASDSPTETNVYEIATTISADKLQDLSYAQGADTMFFAHPKMRPLMLVRNGPHNWKISEIDFANVPYENKGVTPLGWLKPSAATPIGKSITLTLQDDDTKTDYTGAGFQATDVGSYISVNGGIVKISAVSADKKTATGTITSVLTDDHLAAENTWAVQAPSWSDSLGWPSCVALHQQRLLLAGSATFPQTIWGSAIRDYTNFELGTADDAAYSFQLDSDQINPITSLFATNALIALTHSGEFLIGGANNTITPTNISVRVPSNFGASYVRPIRVGTDLLYVQRAGRKLLAMSYDPESQVAYDVSDISMLAEHMTGTDVSIVDAAWQQEPEGLIHLVLSNGEYITITYSKGSQVNGWTINRTGTAYDAKGDVQGWDAVTNVASIPTTNGEDACYVAVNRVVNGRAVTYIELFQSGLNVDCGLIGKVEAANPAKTEWLALQHLEGKTVDIVADGVPMPQQVVTGGKITLTRGAKEVHIGLPFRSTIRTFKPEFAAPMGTVQGAKVSSVNVTVRLLDSIGLTINGDPVPFRQFGPAILDSPTALFTGDIDWQLAGWDNNEVLIEQRQPLPFNLLAIIRTITVN